MLQVYSLFLGLAFFQPYPLFIFLLIYTSKTHKAWVLLKLPYTKSTLTTKNMPLFAQRLDALRSAMAEKDLDAYLVPTTDPHQSEYVADHWKAREWFSGFTGSAGTLIVTPEHAGLWTDSRYFLQAEEELRESGVVLHRQQVAHAPEHIHWLAATLPSGARVGLDGKLFSLTQINYLRRHLGSSAIELDYGHDLVASVWRERTALPKAPVYAHDPAYAGQTRAEKLSRVREEMKALGVAYHLVTTLDDIAWVLNLRGSDVEYNPVFYAYLLIGRQSCQLFIDPVKVPASLDGQLAAEGVTTEPYQALSAALQIIPQSQSVLVDSGSVPIVLTDVLGDNRLETGPHIIRQLKAIKNETEIQHIRQAMRKDGIALLRLFRWLEAQVGHQVITEYDVAEKIAGFRSEQADYVGESFGAIVGYRSNGAIVHYRPHPEKSAHLVPTGLLLVDSGGQYLDGTTDITRTVSLGEPTPVERRHFTLVLKGHINLSRAVFPAGTNGMQLDAMARYPLWQEGLNFGHGTGHGVGFFLNVHEAPQGFAASASTSRGSTALVPGMLTSNEPGLYLPGEYGIRIENLILCVPGPQNEHGQFYQFEPLTMFPIDRRLVDVSLLDAAELKWLNDYHAQVLKELSPLLEDAAERSWLANHCRPW